jgi:hypothetical protein
VNHDAEDYNDRSTMTAKVSTLAALVALVITRPIPAAIAQVPAGVSYDAKKHPNPIVTWVNERDFRPATFADAADKVGVELMSLSKDQGERTSVELAIPPASKQKVRIIGAEYEVTFYPVMRQTYKLKSGNTFILYTFRFPRAQTTADFLNQAAFGPWPRGETPRFGPMKLPERMEIRAHPGLYFDEKARRFAYWFELGSGFSVTSNAPMEEFFRVIDDLL